MSALARVTGTVFGIGRLRPAPGTWGSAAALPLFWGLFVLGGLPLVLLATGAVFILGIWSTTALTEGQRDPDPSEVVIDEVLGQMIALMPLAFAAQRHDLPILTFWPGWVAAFVLFRLFDILKPGPVGWADRRHDPLGVMLDDAIAGAMAAIGVLLLAGLWHGVLGL